MIKPRLLDLFCPKCDGIRTGNYCRTCGTILVPKPPNPKCSCGEEVSENDNYCRWCQKKVEVK